MNLYDYILNYASPFILIIGIFLNALSYNFFGRTSKLLFFYLIGSFLIDLLARVFAYYENNNLILWILLSAIELSIFSSLYFLLIKKSVVRILFLVGICYIALEMLFVDTKSISSFQIYSKVVASFLIVLMVLIYLFNYIKSEDRMIWKELYLHFIILGYFSLNIIVLLPINFLINQGSSSAIYIWYVYLISTLTFYIYLTFYLWKNGKRQKQLLSGY